MDRILSTIQFLKERLAWHSERVPGRVLSHANVDPGLGDRVHGTADLPSIKLVGLTYEETIETAVMIRPMLVLTYEVATRKADGLEGWISLVDELSDALEMRTDGTMDLDGRLTTGDRKLLELPPTLTFENPAANDQSVYGDTMFRMTLFRTSRVNRRREQ